MYLVGIVSSRGSICYVPAWNWPLVAKLQSYSCKVIGMIWQGGVTQQVLRLLGQLPLSSPREVKTNPWKPHKLSLQWYWTHTNIPKWSSRWEDSNEIHKVGLQMTSSTTFNILYVGFSTVKMVTGITFLLLNLFWIFHHGSIAFDPENTSQHPNLCQHHHRAK